MSPHMNKHTHTQCRRMPYLPNRNSGLCAYDDNRSFVWIAEHNIIVKGTEKQECHVYIPLLPLHCVPSLWSVHLLPSFSLLLSHLDISAQKVSKCQMGVVIIFNGAILLHRITVHLRLCVWSWREYNWMEWNAGILKMGNHWLSRTHLCMRREKLE